jgi:hypothetical protein
MTFQPPPPGENPPPPPPPPPPPGQWGPPPGGAAGGGSSFDPKSVNPLDWGILAAGLLAFIFSFVSYYSYSYRGHTLGHWNAWHGFFGWFAMLLALIGSAVVAMELFAPHVKMPWPNRLVGLIAYAVATLCVILAIFVIPGDTGGADAFGVHIDKGHGVGFWISLIVIIAGLVLSLMRFQQTGGTLPGPLANMPNIGAKGPQGGIGGQQGGMGGQQGGLGGQQGGMGGPQNPPPPPPPPSYGPPPSQ